MARDDEERWLSRYFGCASIYVAIAGEVDVPTSQRCPCVPSGACGNTLPFCRWPATRSPEGAKGGGDGGIRTLDRPLQAYNGLANRRLQPLGHVSVTGRYARRAGAPQATHKKSVLQARRAAEPPGGRGDRVTKMRHPRLNGRLLSHRLRSMHWKGATPAVFTRSDAAGRPDDAVQDSRTRRIRFSELACRRSQRRRAIQVMPATQGFLVCRPRSAGACS